MGGHLFSLVCFLNLLCFLDVVNGGLPVVNSALSGLAISRRWLAIAGVSVYIG